MKPARFILSLLGVALFLAIGTIFAIEAIAHFSGTLTPGWESGSGATIVAILLLLVLVLRAILLWVEKRTQRR